MSYLKIKRKQSVLFLAVLSTVISCRTDRTTRFDVLVLNAGIIDLEQGGVKDHRLIGITDDTIRLVDATSNRKKYDANTIFDASNKYVMPGLWDMHVHFRGGDSLINENKNLLPLFLAYGVTTVRDAGGDISKSVLDWRREVAAGELDGPRIFTSGPKLDGPDPAWPGSLRIETGEDIETALDSLESLGVDYVKMYDGSLSKEMYYGIIKAATARGLKTTGHMPLSADMVYATTLGLNGTEHLYYVAKSCSPLGDSLRQANPGYAMFDQIIATYDPIRAQGVFRTLAKNDVSITPTLHIVKTLAEVLDVDHQQDSLLDYVGKGIQKTYEGRVARANRAREIGKNPRQPMNALGMKILVPLYEAGINLLAGSDCGAFNSYVYPGQSLHAELSRMVQAGLSPQQALRTSVLNGPKFFGLESYYGSIARGKVGDLIVLDGNPLENIQNSNGIHAVIHRGKVYDRKKIADMLELLRQQNKIQQ